MNLALFLEALKAAGPLIARVPELREGYRAAVAVLKGGDQPVARDAIDDLAEANDAGFARLDAKLEAAKNR